MKMAIWAAAGWLLLAAAPAWAEDVASASGGVFSSILKVIVKWIFPVCAAYCFLHGVIGKGVKRGEWDMAALGVLAAVSLALFPKLLSKLFGVDL
jgi:hypothetical protein